MAMENANPTHDFDSLPLPQGKIWGNQTVHQFNGFWFLLPHLQGIQNVLNNFKPLPSDVILTSFPKTGTTWLKSLLFSIVNRSSKQSLTTNHPHELVPFLEIQVYAPNAPSPPQFPTTNSSSSGRVLSTHIPHQILARTLDLSDCRVVYVTRNPKDTIVSLWHFVNTLDKTKEEQWPLEEAVEKFCRGFVAYGPYNDHVLGYHKASLETPNKVFFITYEELMSDPKTHVKRLGEFLGCPFDQGDDGELEVEEIVRSCSIETLKNHEVNKSNDCPTWGLVPYHSFFRKGEIGDYQNYLSKEMVELIDATIVEKFHGSCFAEVAKNWIVKQGDVSNGS